MPNPPYSPVAVANWFIRRAEEDGQRLDPMKLIKLVYLAHGWHLATTGEPLINETVEAWQYGPVVPTLYHTFKSYGRHPIQGVALEVQDFDFSAPLIPSTDFATIELLERVWTIYGHFSGVQLSQLTHRSGSPWHEAWNRAKSQGKVRGVDIPDQDLKFHFTHLARRHGAAGAH